MTKPTPRCTDCDCPIDVDPFGTGDIWYTERNCQRPFNCPHDDNGKADEEDEE